MVQTGSQTTFTSTLSTPSRRLRRSGIALDIDATNGHQPVVRTRSTSTCEPSRRTSSTTPMSTIEIPRSAQHGSYTSRSASIRAGRSVMGSSHLGDGYPEAGGGRGAGGVGGLRARAAQPPARVEVGAAADDPPAVGRAVGDPLPDVAGELLGAERACARRVGGDRHGPAPAALGTRAQRLVEDIAPRPRAGVGAARQRLPLVRARQAHAPIELARRPCAERLGVGACDVGRRMVGELRTSSFAETGRPVAAANARMWALTIGQRPISTRSSATARSSPGSPIT